MGVCFDLIFLSSAFILDLPLSTKSSKLYNLFNYFKHIFLQYVYLPGNFAETKQNLLLISTMYKTVHCFKLFDDLYKFWLVI